MSLELDSKFTTPKDLEAKSGQIVGPDMFLLGNIKLGFKDFFEMAKYHLNHDFENNDPRHSLKKALSKSKIVDCSVRDGESTIKLPLNFNELLDASYPSPFQIMKYKISSLDFCFLIDYLLRNTNLNKNDPRIDFIQSFSD